MARSFSVKVRPSSRREREDYGDQVVTIHADPEERNLPDGSTRIGMGLPVLTVSGWVADPEKRATKVARLLTAAEAGSSQAEAA